jgi:hypothetical protein
MTIKVSRNIVPLYSLPRCLACFLLALLVLCATCQGQAWGQQPPQVGGEISSSTDRTASVGLTEEEKVFLESLDARIKKMEEVLQGISRIGKIAESRSLDNKIMAREQRRLAFGILIVLMTIALIFPLTIWLLSRKRLLGLSGLSDEVAATILVVEERQAKLAGILEEIQFELDEGYARTSPDLKNLMDQAKQFLDENKRDLERVGKGRSISAEKPS